MATSVPPECIGKTAIATTRGHTPAPSSKPGKFLSSVVFWLGLNKHCTCLLFDRSKVWIVLSSPTCCRRQLVLMTALKLPFLLLAFLLLFLLALFFLTFSSAFLFYSSCFLRVPSGLALHKLERRTRVVLVSMDPHSPARASSSPCFCPYYLAAGSPLVQNFAYGRLFPNLHCAGLVYSPFCDLTVFCASMDGSLSQALGGQYLTFLCTNSFDEPCAHKNLHTKSWPQYQTTYQFGS